VGPAEDCSSPHHGGAKNRPRHPLSIQLFFVLVQESIKHFPIPLRKSLKVITEGDFLENIRSVGYDRGGIK